MENFKERLRSFLDTELNNLINERCRETNTVLDHRTELQGRLTDFSIISELNKEFPAI